MTRTKVTADPWLCAVAAAQSRADQPDALFAALDEAVKSAIGHKLFTILTYDGDSGEAARVYSNLPGPYPTGGRKRLAPGPWTEAVLDRGEAYIGRTQDDLRKVFSDLESRGRGEHDVQDAGAAGDLTGASRAWEFGDEQPLDVVRTVRNAVLRTGPGAVRLQVEDFEVVETERRTTTAARHYGPTPLTGARPGAGGCRGQTWPLSWAGRTAMQLIALTERSTAAMPCPMASTMASSARSWLRA